MSAETQPTTASGGDAPLTGVARQVRRAYNALGRAPSASEAADHGPYNRNTLERRHVDARWHEVLQAAGVPTPRDVVVADLRERYADRYDWDGDSVRVRASQVAESTGLRTVRIGHTLKRIVESDDPRGQPDGLVIERGGIRTGRSSAWIVHGEDGGDGEAVTDGGQVVETTGDIDDPDEYKCEFCEVTRPEARPLKTHLIAEHAKEVASRHWAEHVDIGILAPDGGVSLPQVIADVLDDAAPGGLDRQVLLTRVAEVSGATLDDVEEVLGGELRRGAVIESGGEIKTAPNRGLAGRSGRQ